jgi:hypothetical protein
VRILVTIAPRMYREAIAGYLLQHRPGYEVRSSPPQNVEEEVILFAPHLLVHGDPDGLDPEVLRGVPCWIEVLYSDSMDARISVDGRVEETLDISTDVLLRVADESAAGIRDSYTDPLND